MADDASNEVESIAVQVKAAEKALKKARKAYDKADADATRLKEDVDGSQEELERIASEKDDVLQAKVQAQQACDSAANALSVKKAELETLSQDADAIKAVEVDIQNQVDDYARALKDNGKKQKQCDALLKELRAEHAAEVRDFAQVFQEMDARKKEEAMTRQISTLKKELSDMRSAAAFSASRAVDAARRSRLSWSTIWR